MDVWFDSGSTHAAVLDERPELRFPADMYMEDVYKRQQLDGLLKERSGALYDLLDALDTARYSDVDSSADAYLLAQNKLWITTGDTAGFADQIALLAQQAQTVQAQLGNPTQILAPTTGYFVRAASSGRLNAGAADILAQSPEQLKALSLIHI